MPGLLAFPVSSDGAIETVASLTARTDSRKAWIVLALAVATAALDRFAVIGVTGAVYAGDGLWQRQLVLVLAAVVGAGLLGRWLRTAGLSLAERVCDTVLLSAAQRVAATDWRAVSGAEPARTLARIAGAMRADACQVAVALPGVIAIPITVAWIGVHEPATLPIIGISSLLGAILLRGEIARTRAGQAVLADAEAGFEDTAARLLETSVPPRLTGVTQADLCGQSLWPAVDDATRAASIHAEAHARATGLFGWVSLLLVIVLLGFAPAGGPDRDWMRALLVIAATLPAARQSSSAYLAFKRVAAAASRIDAIAARFPAEAVSASPAPARWTTIAYRNIRLRGQDTPDVHLAPLGPLDLELSHAEIIAVTGPNPHERATLLHLLCGLVAPDEGAVLLDGRAIPPPMLRGLFCGLPDNAPPRTAAPPPGPRAAALLDRFELPAAILDPAARDDAIAGLSEPERVRLAIIATDLEDRQVRLYGEYASYLDPRHREAFVETLQESRARGRSSVVATEDPAIIAAADRVVLIRDGRLAGPGAAAP